MLVIAHVPFPPKKYLYINFKYNIENFDRNLIGNNLYRIENIEFDKIIGGIHWMMSKTFGFFNRAAVINFHFH